MLETKNSANKPHVNQDMNRSSQQSTPAPLHQQVARLIYDLRTRAGLTQQELAARVGTTQPAIARLEAKTYRGHSLAMLQRIVTAVDGKVEIRLSQENDAHSH